MSFPRDINRFYSNSKLGASDVNMKRHVEGAFVRIGGIFTFDIHKVIQTRASFFRDSYFRPVLHIKETTGCAKQVMC